MGYLSPRKALPDSEAYRDGWIEVATGCRGTGDDRKGDINSKAPTDLKDAAEGRGIRLRSIYIEGSDGCYAGEAGPTSISWPFGAMQEARTHRKRPL